MPNLAPGWAPPVSFALDVSLPAVLQGVAAIAEPVLHSRFEAFRRVAQMQHAAPESPHGNARQALEPDWAPGRRDDFVSII